LYFTTVYFTFTWPVTFLFFAAHSTFPPHLVPGTVFAAAAASLSILALSSMSSLFPMGYLALTTAILHRVAQFEGMQWPQRCSRFAASGTTRISYAFTYRTV